MSIKARMQQKHDVETNWKQAKNFSPLAGELIVYDADSAHTSARFKIGDGKTNVNDLPFVVEPAEVEAVADTPAKRGEDGSIKATIEFQPNSNIHRPLPYRLPKRSKICYWNGTIASNFSEGDGTQDNPYIIASAEEFAKAVSAFTDRQYRYFKIADDIATIYLQSESVGLQNNRARNANFFFGEQTLYQSTPLSWNNVINNKTIFCGEFDGNGCEIVGAYASNSNEPYQSLFGDTYNTTVKNLTVSQCYFITGYYGSVIGSSDGKQSITINNVCLQDNFVKVTSAVSGMPNICIGLFAGRAGSISLNNCYSRNNSIKYTESTGSLTDYTTIVGGPVDRGAVSFEKSFFKDCSYVLSQSGISTTVKDCYAYNLGSSAGFKQITADCPTPENAPLLDWVTSWLPVNEETQTDAVAPLSFLNFVTGALNNNLNQQVDTLTKGLNSKKVYYNQFSGSSVNRLKRNAVYLVVANKSSNDLSFYKQDGTTALPNIKDNSCRSALVFLPGNCGHGYIAQIFKQSIPTVSGALATYQFDIDDNYEYIVVKSNSNIAPAIYSIEL